METNKDMQELEQMRKQMDILKQKLDKQEIVNQQMLRHTMKSRMSWINKYRWISLMAIPFVALCFLLMVHDRLISWWFYAFTVGVVAVSSIMDFFVNRLSDKSIMNENLLELSQKLVKMKKIRKTQTIIGLIVVALWVAWLMYEVYTHGSNNISEEYAKIMMISMGVGALIGGSIGVSIYLKMQRTNDDLIQQIEDLTSGN